MCGELWHRRQRKAVVGLRRTRLAVMLRASAMGMKQASAPGTKLVEVKEVSALTLGLQQAVTGTEL